MGHTIAAVIGVANPQPFDFRGRHFAFATARGVMQDVDWYAGLISRRITANDLTLVQLTEPDQTRAVPLRQTLSRLAQTVSAGDTFILVLIGHGFQVKDDDGDEIDGLDEVFAAQDGPIVDDDFAKLWQPMDASASVVIFADTCSSDGLGLRGAEPPNEHVVVPAAGPSRLCLSASMQMEKASTVPSRNNFRGVMSLALEDAWAVSGSRISYENWFRQAAEFVAVRAQRQHPQLRYLGPDRGLLTRAPFT